MAASASVSNVQLLLCLRKHASIAFLSAAKLHVGKTKQLVKQYNKDELVALYCKYIHAERRAMLRETLRRVASTLAAHLRWHAASGDLQAFAAKTLQRSFEQRHRVETVRASLEQLVLLQSSPYSRGARVHLFGSAATY